jgi:Zn-dependent protease with chaperone function
MKGRTLLASFATLFLLCGFVFTTVLALALSTSDLPPLASVGIGVAITIVWSFLVWLIAPWIMDLVQRWLYGAIPMQLDYLPPKVAQFIQGVCAKHNIKVPRLMLIQDGTPQAYCYGSYANNSRLVVTQGILNYLNEEEVAAVYAHELGHIVHRDFIVMTVASTLLNVLWHVYVACKELRGKNNSRPLFPVAVVAYVFWWISQYAILYLSRTREYYADEFAAEETGNPNALSMALVKIAYGITQQAPTVASTKFLGATRAMGVADFKAATGIGTAYSAIAKNQAPQPQHGAQTVAAQAGYGPQVGYGVPPAMNVDLTLPVLRQIERVFLFDLFNPWATVLEIGSTHPLTGKRIRALCEHATKRNGNALFSFDRTDAQGYELDTARLYGGFFFELLIYCAPYIGAFLCASVSIVGVALGHQTLTVAGLASIVFGVGLGMMVRGLVQFPSLASATPTTVLELMSDPYASPLRGRPVVLQGKVIGRADAGNRMGEDMMMEDQAGGLIMLNYESIFGFFGNWYFAAKRLATLVEQGIQARGWFRRGTSQLIDLADAKTESGYAVSSYTRFWGMATAVLVTVIGLALTAAAALSSIQH